MHAATVQRGDFKANRTPPVPRCIVPDELQDETTSYARAQQTSYDSHERTTSRSSLPLPPVHEEQSAGAGPARAAPLRLWLLAGDMLR